VIHRDVNEDSHPFHFQQQQYNNPAAGGNPLGEENNYI
jgi:hypothetical protein